MSSDFSTSWSPNPLLPSLNYAKHSFSPDGITALQYYQFPHDANQSYSDNNNNYWPVSTDMSTSSNTVNILHVATPTSHAAITPLPLPTLHRTGTGDYVALPLSTPTPSALAVITPNPNTPAASSTSGNYEEVEILQHSPIHIPFSPQDSSDYTPTNTSSADTTATPCSSTSTPVPQLPVAVASLLQHRAPPTLPPSNPTHSRAASCAAQLHNLSVTIPQVDAANNAGRVERERRVIRKVKRETPSPPPPPSSSRAASMKLEIAQALPALEAMCARITNNNGGAAAAAAGSSANSSSSSSSSAPRSMARTRSYDSDDSVSDDDDDALNCTLNPNDPDYKKKKLARKAELARLSRKRKKTRLQDLEAEVRRLEDELVHVKRQKSSRDSSFDRSDDDLLATTVAQLMNASAQGLCQHPAQPTDPAQPSPLTPLLEQFVQIQKRQQSNANNHLEALGCHIKPALPLQFLTWIMTQNEKFVADPCGLWATLWSQELQISQSSPQYNEVLSLRQTLNKQHIYMGELERAFAKLKNVLQKQMVQSNKNMERLRAILTEKQFTKYIEWVEKFGKICVQINA